MFLKSSTSMTVLRLLPMCLPDLIKQQLSFPTFPRGPTLTWWVVFGQSTYRADTDSHTQQLIANDVFDVQGTRYQILGNTVPNLQGQDGIDLLTYQYTSWKSFVGVQELLYLDDTMIYTMAFQPFPHQIAEQSNARGPNTLGLDPDKGDYIWME